jgi:aminopeptidase N
VPIQAAVPARLRDSFAHDFARQPQMMQLFIELFGPYPLSNGYTVVVTDDELEMPLEAQGISIFGANHCDGTRRSERLIAHELAHQWFGNSVTVRRWRDRESPQDLLLADPGPKDMFDDRVYKRGALTLHALRKQLGDENFFALLRDWTARYRHGTVVTDDFTGLAAKYAHESLRPLWEAWLYSTGVP